MTGRSECFPLQLCMLRELPKHFKLFKMDGRHRKYGLVIGNTHKLKQPLGYDYMYQTTSKMSV